jgi:hypothetical protein
LAPSLRTLCSPFVGRFRIVLSDNALSARGGRLLLTAADTFDAEVTLVGNPFPFDFVRDAVLLEGRTLNRHLDKVRRGSLRLLRAIRSGAAYMIVAPRVTEGGRLCLQRPLLIGIP